MLNPVEVVMIQTLARQGATVSGITRQLGIDRKTVRKALRRTVDERPRARTPVASLLDPCKAFIQARLSEAEFTAQRLYQDIRSQGYAGATIW